MQWTGEWYLPKGKENVAKKMRHGKVSGRDVKNKICQGKRLTLAVSGDVCGFFFFLEMACCVLQGGAY